MKGNIVITGAGSGLGASLAKKFSELGFHVVLLGRTKSKLSLVAGLLPGKSSIYELDVSSKIEVNYVFQAIEAEVGPICTLINNAGQGTFELAEELGEEAVHNMIDINLKGTIFCSQAVLSGMKQRNKGKIVNIISTAGLEGKVNESVYCASKFGVRGFTDSLLAELNDTSVLVYAVYMGGMKTDFWKGIYKEQEIRNLMDPNDVADIIIDNIKNRRNLNVTEVVIKNKF